MKASGCGRLALRQVGLLPLVLALSCGSPASRAPRYVLIDGGAHEGETLVGFMNSELYQKHMWHIVCFEPNAEVTPKILRGNHVTVLNQALWDRDGEVEFHVSRQASLGASIVDSYIRSPETRTIKVPCIDFGQWLARNYRKSDVVYVKLDVEGAEYAILTKMLRDGTMAYVDKLYIEFHGAQQAEAQGRSAAAVLAERRKDYELVEAITSLGIPVSIHDPGEPQGQYFTFNPEKYGLHW